MNTYFCFRRVNGEIYLSIREDEEDEFLLFCDGRFTQGGGQVQRRSVTVPVVPLVIEEQDP